MANEQGIEKVGVKLVVENLSGFLNDLGRAKRAIRESTELSSKKINIVIGADTKAATAAVQQLEKIVKEAGNLKASVGVDANITAALDGMQQIQQQLATINGASAGIAVLATIEPVLAALSQVESLLRSISGAATSVTVSANIESAIQGITAVESMLKTLNGTESMVTVAASVATALTEIAKVEAAIKAIGGGSASVNVLANTQFAIQELNIIAASLTALNGSRADIQVFAYADVAIQQLGVVQFRLRQIDGSKASVNVLAEARAAAQVISDIAASLRSLNGATANIAIRAEVEGAVQGLAQIEKALNAINGAAADVGINANIQAALDGITLVESRLRSLDGLTATIFVEADVTDALGGLDRVSASVRSLDGARADVVTTADTRAALQGLAGLARSVADLNGKSVTIKPEVDTASASQAFAKMSADAGGAGLRAGNDFAGGVLAGLSGLEGVVAGFFLGIGNQAAQAFVSTIQATAAPARGALNFENQVADIAAVVAQGAAPISAEASTPRIEELIQSVALDPKLIVDENQAREALIQLLRGGISLPDAENGKLIEAIRLQNLAGTTNTPQEFGQAGDIIAKLASINQIPVSETSRITQVSAAVLAQSSLSTLGDVEYAFGNMASAATLLGIEIEDQASLIAGTSSSFKSARELGTAGESFLFNLASPSGPQAKAFETLGGALQDRKFDVADANGEFVGTREIQRQLKEIAASGKFKEVELTGLLRDAFGAYGISFASALIRSEDLATIRKQVEAVDPETAIEIKTSTTGRALENLGGIIATDLRQIFDEAIEGLRPLAVSLSELFQALAPQFEGAGQAVAAFLLPLAEQAAGAIRNLTEIAKAGGSISEVFSGALGSVIGFADQLGGIAVTNIAQLFGFEDVHFGTLTEAIGAVGVALQGWLTPVTEFVDKVSGIASTVSEIFAFLSGGDGSGLTNITKLLELLPKISGFADLFGGFSGLGGLAFGNAGAVVGAGIDGAIDQGSESAGLVTTASTIKATLTTIASDITTGVSEIQAAYESSGIAGVFGELATDLTEGVTKLLQPLQPVAGKEPATAMVGGEQVGGAAATFALNLIEQIAAAISNPDFGSSIGGAVGTLTKNLIGALAGALKGAGAALDEFDATGVGQSINAFLTSFTTELAVGLKDAPTGELVIAVAQFFSSAVSEAAQLLSQIDVGGIGGVLADAFYTMIEDVILAATAGIPGAGKIASFIENRRADRQNLISDDAERNKAIQQAAAVSAAGGDGFAEQQNARFLAAQKFDADKAAGSPDPDNEADRANRRDQNVYKPIQTGRPVLELSDMPENARRQGSFVDASISRTTNQSTTGVEENSTLKTAVDFAGNVLDFIIKNVLPVGGAGGNLLLAPVAGGTGSGGTSDRDGEAARASRLAARTNAANTSYEPTIKLARDFFAGFLPAGQQGAQTEIQAGQDPLSQFPTDFTAPVPVVIANQTTQSVTGGSTQIDGSPTSSSEQIAMLNQATTAITTAAQTVANTTSQVVANNATSQFQSDFTAPVPVVIANQTGTTENIAPMTAAQAGQFPSDFSAPIPVTITNQTTGATPLDGSSALINPQTVEQIAILQSTTTAVTTSATGIQAAIDSFVAQLIAGGTLASSAIAGSMTSIQSAISTLASAIAGGGGSISSAAASLANAILAAAARLSGVGSVSSTAGSTAGSTTRSAASTPGRTRAAAGGGMASGRTLLAEEGAELVYNAAGGWSRLVNDPTIMDLPAGSQVFTANETRNILSRSGGISSIMRSAAGGIEGSPSTTTTITGGSSSVVGGSSSSSSATFTSGSSSSVGGSQSTINGLADVAGNQSTVGGNQSVSAETSRILNQTTGNQSSAAETTKILNQTAINDGSVSGGDKSVINGGSQSTVGGNQSSVSGGSRTLLAERGAEIVYNPAGGWSRLVNNPTIMDLPVGSQVFTANETRNILNRSGGISNVMRSAAGGIGTSPVPDSQLPSIRAKNVDAPPDYSNLWSSIGDTLTEQVYATKTLDATQMRAVDAITQQTATARQSTADIIQELQNVAGVFSRSQVTATDVQLSTEGKYQDKPDELLRRLEAQANGSTEFGDVAGQFREALANVGIQASSDMATLVAQASEAWQSGRLFSNDANLGLINTDAVQRGIEDNQLAEEGKANLQAYLAETLGGVTQAAIQEAIGTAPAVATTGAQTGAQGDAGTTSTTMLQAAIDAATASISSLPATITELTDGLTSAMDQFVDSTEAILTKYGLLGRNTGNTGNAPTTTAAPAAAPVTGANALGGSASGRTLLAEQGAELVYNPAGRWSRLVSKPTIMDLPAGSMVFPATETREILARSTATPPAAMQSAVTGLGLFGALTAALQAAYNALFSNKLTGNAPPLPPNNPITNPGGSTPSPLPRPRPATPTPITVNTGNTQTLGSTIGQIQAISNQQVAQQTVAQAAQTAVDQILNPNVIKIIGGDQSFAASGGLQQVQKAAGGDRYTQQAMVQQFATVAKGGSLVEPSSTSVNYYYNIDNSRTETFNDNKTINANLRTNRRTSEIEQDLRILAAQSR